MYSFTSPNWLFWTQCFLEYMQSLFIIVLREIKADGRKLHSIFFLILQKSKDNFFYCLCTQIKADLLQFRLSSWPRGVAFAVGRGINPVIAPAPHARTFKHSTFTMQPVHYHYKKQPVKHMEKHTALFKYVVKSVLFSVITVPPWSYAKHFVLCGYCKGK